MNLLKQLLLNGRDAIGSFVYPDRCVLCQNITESEDYNAPRKSLCPVCLKKLEHTNQFDLRGNSTEDVFYQDNRFEKGASFLFYDKENNINQLVYAFKYRHLPDVATYLATEAAIEGLQSDFFDDIDVIIPIPLHPIRYRKRGYNQSEYIAQALSQVTKIPTDTTHVSRIRNNRQQALTKGKERETNVKGIFQVNHPEEMYRKHILIVDDVITTGSTIRSCMEAMKEFRGARFSVFALAKAI